MTRPKTETHKEWNGINVGDQVKHPRWGVGTVMFRSGSGEDSKAVVVFPEEGQKKLLLRHAKLKKVGSAPKGGTAAVRAAAAGARAQAPEKSAKKDDKIAGSKGDSAKVPKEKKAGASGAAGK
ncbi:DUF3553 domain-containing protein [Candidatus Sumerlaeota bacterium]|nr:DUF3553 domain-containing protein [Candidatus Sumerlaeota bacterium]